MLSSALDDRPLAVSFAKAAQLTSLSKKTLRRAARLGTLPTARFGRRRIIPFDALRNLIREGGEGIEQR
jgi:excisionase family DNA binding protein